MELSGPSMPLRWWMQGCLSTSSLLPAKLAVCKQVGVPVSGPRFRLQLMERQHIQNTGGLWEGKGWRPALDDTAWPAAL